MLIVGREPESQFVPDALVRPVVEIGVGQALDVRRTTVVERML